MERKVSGVNIDLSRSIWATPLPLFQASTTHHVPAQRRSFKTGPTTYPKAKSFQRNVPLAGAVTLAGESGSSLSYSKMEGSMIPKYNPGRRYSTAPSTETMDNGTLTLPIEVETEGTQTEDFLQGGIFPGIPGSLPSDPVVDLCKIDRGTSPINVAEKDKPLFEELEQITGHIIIQKFITRSQEEFQQLIKIRFPGMRVRETSTTHSYARNLPDADARKGSSEAQTQSEWDHINQAQAASSQETVTLDSSIQHPASPADIKKHEHEPVEVHSHAPQTEHPLQGDDAEGGASPSAQTVLEENVDFQDGAGSLENFQADSTAEDLDAPGNVQSSNHVECVDTLDNLQPTCLAENFGALENAKTATSGVSLDTLENLQNESLGALENTPLDTSEEESSSDTEDDQSLVEIKEVVLTPFSATKTQSIPTHFEMLAEVHRDADQQLDIHVEEIISNDPMPDDISSDPIQEDKHVVEPDEAQNCNSNIISQEILSADQSHLFLEINTVPQIADSNPIPVSDFPVEDRGILEEEDLIGGGESDLEGEDTERQVLASVSFGGGQFQSDDNSDQSIIYEDRSPDIDDKNMFKATTAEALTAEHNTIPLEAFPVHRGKSVATQTEVKSAVRRRCCHGFRNQESVESSANSSGTDPNVLDLQLRVQKLDVRLRVGGLKTDKSQHSPASAAPSMTGSEQCLDILQVHGTKIKLKRDSKNSQEKH